MTWPSFHAFVPWSSCNFQVALQDFRRLTSGFTSFPWRKAHLMIMLKSGRMRIWRSYVKQDPVSIGSKWSYVATFSVEKWTQSIKDSSLRSGKLCGTEQVNLVPGFSWWTWEINIGEADRDSTVLNRERKLVILICLRKVQVFIMSWSMYKELVKTSSPHNKNRNEVFPTKMPLEWWAVTQDLERRERNFFGDYN